MTSATHHVVLLATLFQSFIPFASGALLQYETIALSGSEVPSLHDAAMFASFEGVTLNGEGHVAFTARLRGGTVTSDDDVGIFLSDGDATSLIAREGSIVPGVNDSARYATLGLPHLSDLGDVAFYAGLDRGAGALDSSGTNAAIMKVTETSGEPIARTGYLVPGAIDQAVYDSFHGTFTTRIQQSRTGAIAFRANLRTGTGPDVDSNNDFAIVGAQSGSVSIVAREGWLANGVADGAVLADFRSTTPTVDNRGQITFVAALRTGEGPVVSTSTDSAIYGESGQNLIFREGELAPAVSDGAVFNNFGQLAVNDSGQYAFLGFLRTGSGPAVTALNNSALFGPVGAGLGVVARENNPAPGAVDGALFDQINSTLSFVMNARGEVAFETSLRRGSGSEVDESNNSAILGPTREGFGIIAREGDQAPGIPGGAVFRFQDLNPFKAGGTVAMNAVGDVVFQCRLQSSSDGPLAPVKAAVFAYSGITNELLPVVVQGDLFDVDDRFDHDDLREVAEFRLLTESGGESGRPLSLNDNGQIVIQLYFTDGSEGVFTAQLPLAIPEPTSIANYFAAIAILLMFRNGHPSVPCSR